MIVCWVLFALSAATAGVGWFGAERVQNDIDLIRAESEAAATSERSESYTIHDYNDLAGPGRAATPEEVADINSDLRERRLEELDEELEPLSSKEKSLATIMNVGLFSAAALLLWNIIWHTGHWVWMGRETRQ
jgi:hypothetical protein